jgi:hypothetical protein
MTPPFGSAAALPEPAARLRKLHTEGERRIAARDRTRSIPTM